MGVDPTRTGDGLLSALPSHAAASPALNAFFAQYFARNPVTATFTGIHAHDHRLPDWSPQARLLEIDEMRAVHAQVSADHPYPHDGFAAFARDPDALDAELARANLDVRIAEAQSSHFHRRNPALWTGEAIFGCVSLMIRPFAPFEERLPALAARLSAIPEFLAALRETLTEPTPAVWTQRALRECAAAEELFNVGLLQWLALHQPSADRHSLHANSLPSSSVDAVFAAAARARAAFADTARWLEARVDAGDHNPACGEELLAVLLTRGHFCEEAPRQLLARATDAMKNAHEQLTLALVPFEGSWSRAQSAMAEDCCTLDEYYGAFERRWQEIRAGVTRHDAVTWPRWPIRYVPIPPWASASAPRLYWLFYRSPAPFDPYDVYDYVVTPVDDTLDETTQRAQLAAWNHSVITLNHVVHHGGVGHHVQNWHARHRSTSRIGTLAAVDAASRIGMFLGGTMAEGWACYATGLTEELGLLSDLEVISERHTSVRLLARAIVDLRLHLGDWTFAQGIAYYEEQVGMSHDVAVAETTKNSMFPATALMYWLGTQTIRDLRAQLRSTRSDAEFSLKAFHDELLSRGAIPVPLVARLMTTR